MYTKREKKYIRQKIISTLLGVGLLIGAIYIYVAYQPNLFNG
tara:strand:+ start:397 stop:522 length:126 start_codon:yes stop_codon:yes gene_type:complete